jgi:hypothetical protein
MNESDVQRRRLARADMTESVVIPHNYLASIIVRDQPIMLSELDGRQRIPKKDLLSREFAYW